MPVALRMERGPHAGVSRREIARRIGVIVAALRLQEHELSIVLTDDSQIHKLNKDYRGIDRPTDVLAFAMSEGDFGSLSPGLLGDVIVSVPTAARQAATADRPLLDELTMLLAHGVLHLLGWDHDTKAKDARMRAETERLCALAAPIRKRAPGRPPTTAGQRGDRPRR